MSGRGGMMPAEPIEIELDGSEVLKSVQVHARVRMPRAFNLRFALGTLLLRAGARIAGFGDIQFEADMDHA